MRLIRRKPRKPEGCGKLELERIIGLTTSTPSGLACNGTNEELAYLAGCVVVIYNVRTNCQTHFLMARGSPKPFSCVAFSSQGGKFIAAGESGHQPAVVVWEVATHTCIAEMTTHKYGVSSVQFSPNSKHLVSLGLPHDGYMCLWDWKSGALLMKTRAAGAALEAYTLHFATDSSFFVSGGVKHLKQWTIGGPRARSSGMTTNPGMDGRPIKLGSQKESTFVSVSSSAASRELTAGAPSYQPIYALTSSGVLCLLHRGVAVEKWVDLQVRKAYALATTEGYVACACSDGVVRIFLEGSLEYSATLPRPAPYGYHGLTDANVGAYLALGHRVTAGMKFPDAIACTFLQQGQKIAVIYNDHSLYVWDVRSYEKVGRYRTFLSHSSCIWDVVSLPDSFHSTNVHSMFGGEAFATSSADGSIRLWHLDLGQDDTTKASTVYSSVENAHAHNVYSKDILGVLYIDSLGEQKGKISSTDAVEEPVDATVGFRSISVSPDGNHLAAGDSSGNLRIFDLNSLLLHSFQEAHDAEILSLDYTTVVGENRSCGSDPFTSSLLASAGRDRLIHIYDVNRGYDVVETLDDHTASITTVRFACSGSKLLSCSADKSVVFRNVEMTSSGCKTSRYHQEIAMRGTLYDMDIDASDKLVVTVGQEKKLNILSLASGKPVRCFKPEGDIGEPIKVRMDPSGSYVVCSNSDRCLRIYNFITGEPLAEALGHAEVITGMTFLPDCRRLVSVSGDSCIFVWRLPITLSRAMRKRSIVTADSRPPLKTLKSLPRSDIKEVPRAAKIPRVDQLKGEVMHCRSSLSDSVDTDENACPTEPGEHAAGPVERELDSNTLCKETDEAVVGELTPAAFKFSISRLPPWAKIALDAVGHATGDNEDPHPTGDVKKSFHSRWAERLGREGYKLFSEFMEEVTPPTTIRASGFGAKRRFSVEGGAADSDSSPESAISLSQSSSTSSPSLIPRKETHWTTVHTVFLDDSDFDDTSPKAVRLPNGIQTQYAQAENREAKTLPCIEQEQNGDENTVDVKGGPLDEEGEPVAIIAAKESDRLSVESEEDDIAENDEFGPCRDLFSAHFDKLASDPKVGESARKSLSSRFFAQANPKLPGLSLAGHETISRSDNQEMVKEINISELTSSRGVAETSVKDLRLEGSPQLPDLVPSSSPQLKQERKGDDLSAGTCGRGTSPDDFPQLATHGVLATPTVDEGQNSRDPVLLPGLDGILNRCALSFVGRTRESERNKEDREENAHASITGVFAMGSDMDDPFHSSNWETLSTRNSPTKGLPRPVEDYQTALKELMDAASKASVLFDEIYSFCCKRNPTEANFDSVNFSKSSVPPDVVRSGQAYQESVPESFQMIHKLMDKVSACAFSQDPADITKSSDDTTMGFHKTNDYGRDASQTWPRASGVSLDSMISSVDMESFISRYSETLASQVLALVQKSLPPSAPP